MARPTKQGLDYFPLDTVMDSKTELFEAEHGLIGFAILIKLFQKIYDNGYYCEWNDDEKLLFAKKINIDVQQIDVYINSAINRKIFDEALLKKYNILTSRGIQKRFLEACKRRKQIEFIKDICLINFNSPDYLEFSKKIVFVNNNLINVTLTDINATLTSQNVDNNSQIKEKEIKENKSKVNKEVVVVNNNLLYNENVEKVQKIMIETIGTTNTNNIMECIAYLDKLPIELIEYALKKTARIQRPSWIYAIPILDSYVQKGYKNIEQVLADDLNYKSKNSHSKNITAEEEFRNEHR